MTTPLAVAGFLASLVLLSVLVVLVVPRPYPLIVMVCVGGLVGWAMGRWKVKHR